jgi:hypothetical protein
LKCFTGVNAFAARTRRVHGCVADESETIAAGPLRLCVGPHWLRRSASDLRAQGCVYVVGAFDVEHCTGRGQDARTARPLENTRSRLGTAEGEKARHSIKGVQGQSRIGAGRWVAQGHPTAYVPSRAEIWRVPLGATSTLLRAAAGGCRFELWRDHWHHFRTKSER